MSGVSVLPLTWTSSSAKPAPVVTALRDGISVAAKRHAVKSGGRQKGAGRNRARVRTDIHPAGGQCREIAGGTAQKTRQNESARERFASGRRHRLGGSALVFRHRRHEASSTIQLTNSSNECPACRAISGAKDVGVMPGWVLISSQMTSPFSEKRSS